MTAYVIVEMEVIDSNAADEYRKLAGASVQAHGGRFIVRGGKSEVLEGDWNPKRVVVLEFPDDERARSWWSSKQYAEAKVVRERAARNVKMLLVDGVA